MPQEANIYFMKNYQHQKKKLKINVFKLSCLLTENELLQWEIRKGICAPNQRIEGTEPKFGITRNQ